MTSEMLLEEADALQAARASKRIEHGSTLGSIVRPEEERVAPGEGDVSVEPLDKVVVQMVVSPGKNIL